MSILFRVLAVFFGVFQALLFPLTGLLTVGHFNTAALDRVPASHYREVSYTPVNPNATPEARALMRWLWEKYGNFTISGQYVSPYQDYTRDRYRDEDGNLDVRLTNEMRAIYDLTGRRPAVIGLDFTGVEFPDQWEDWVTQLAIQHHELGGIVTFCWHWLVPRDIYAPPEERNRWNDYSTFNPDTNFDLRVALADENHPGHAWLLHGITQVAQQLLVLQEAGVPVLWRPLHEAAGRWFWWGAFGREAYLELYNLIFDRLTYVYGLNNLIWVWNAQHHRWYPGDDRVDILGDDPYALAHIGWLYVLDPARSIRFRYTRRASPNKMVAMTENDALPNPDFMWQQNTRWLMFVTWDRERLLLPDPDDQPWGHLPVFSGRYDCARRKIRIYNDPRIITLDRTDWQDALR